MAKQDLLIISCSQRKNNGQRLVPAIELYDGPGYRVLRNRLDGMHNSPAITASIAECFAAINRADCGPNLATVCF